MGLHPKFAADHHAFDGSADHAIIIMQNNTSGVTAVLFNPQSGTQKRLSLSMQLDYVGKLALTIGVVRQQGMDYQWQIHLPFSFSYKGL